MNTDEKGNELPEITYYQKWALPLVHSREAKYPYRPRPVQAWCKVELRGHTFYVHESLDEDWENHEMCWVFTEAETGARVYETKNVYPGHCMEQGWKKVLRCWPQFLKCKQDVLRKLRGVVEIPAILLCL